MIITRTSGLPRRALGYTNQSRVLWLLVCLVAWLGTGPAAAEDREFQVRRVQTRLENEVYRLDADIALRLSGDAREALENGVPLTIDLSIQVLRPRWLVWDERIAALKQSYRLRYHALSQQYLVTNLNTGIQQTFTSRGSALKAIGTLRDFPMLDRRLLKVGESYAARLRARLDIESLPVPLRPLAYLSSEWRLSSEWYEWPLPS
jgi:hypothetical protein